MAAFNFPNSPSTNDLHTENGVTYKWNGTVWKRQNASYTDATNLNVTGIATFVNNVSIGGVLTYEDVKNVDSIGIVTARGGLNVTANTDTDTLNVSGISTLGSPSANNTTFINSSTAANSEATTLVVGHGSGNYAGMTFQCAANYPGAVYFTDTDTGKQGGMAYYHIGDELRLYAGETQKMALNSDGTTINNGSLFVADKITHNGDTNTHIRFPAADTITAETGGTERLRITSTGEVGIGIDDPYYPLDVRFSSSTTALSGGGGGDWGGLGLRLQNNNTTVGSMSLIHFRSGDNADWHIGTKFVGTGDSDIVFLQEGVNEKLRIKNDGKIGIGTITPGDLVHINTTGNVGGIRFGNGQNLNAGTIRSNWNSIDLIAEQNLTFQTNSNTRMKITSAGHIGINTTAPEKRFTIWANDSDVDTDVFQVRGKTGAFNIRVNDADASNPEWAIRTYASEPIVFMQGTTERARFDSSGNIVFANTSTEIKTNTSDGSDNKRIILAAGGDNSQSRGAQIALYGNEYSSHQGRLQLLAGNSGNTNGVIDFYTGGLERLHLEADGDLRIGKDDSNYGWIRGFSGTTGDMIFDADKSTSGSNGSNLIFRTRGSEKLRIANDGKVHFGNQDSVGANGYILKEISGDYKFNIFASSSTTTSRIITFNTRSNVEAMRITSAGGVHIGNTFTAHTAADDLVVGATSGSNGMTILTGDATGSIFFNNGSANNGAIQYVHTGDDYMRFNSEGMHQFDVGGTEVMRIQANGEIAMKSNGSPTDALAGLHVQNGTFRVSQANAPTTAYTQITSHTSGQDGNRHRIATWNSADVCSFAVDHNGTVMAHASHYAGRTRGDANNAQPEMYRHGAHHFTAYSARTDDATNYRSFAMLRAWDGGDRGDRNVLYYADSNSDTTTVDYDQHQTFGVKADGSVHGLVRFFSGRVESDEGTPNSVYGSGRGGCYGYETNSSAAVYMLAEAGGSSSTYFMFARTSNDDIQWKHRTSDGRMYVDASATTFNGADYAEYFEWSDGNSSNEDRAGYTVVLKDGSKIGIATAGDSPSSIIGVISAAPAIIGDGQDLSWRGKWKKDEFGREITTPVQYLVWNHGYEDDENGNRVPVKQPDPTDQESMQNADTQGEVGTKLDKMIADGEVPQFAIDNNIIMNATRRVKDPLYDETKKYVPREFRQEWSPVGLVGKLIVRKGQVVGDRWIKMKDINDQLEQYLVR